LLFAPIIFQVAIFLTCVPVYKKSDFNLFTKFNRHKKITIGLIYEFRDKPASGDGRLYRDTTTYHSFLSLTKFIPSNSLHAFKKNFRPPFTSFDFFHFLFSNG
jgi:hypothetical protein